MYETERKFEEAATKMMAAEREMKMKMEDAATGQLGRSQSGIGSTMGLGAAAEDGLRDRIHRKLIRAGQERAQYDRLAELEYLMEKHPEVARMLELLDATKGV